MTYISEVLLNLEVSRATIHHVLPAVPPCGALCLLVAECGMATSVGTPPGQPHPCSPATGSLSGLAG